MPPLMTNEYEDDEYTEASRELWDADGQAIRAARQLAIEDVLAKIILSLRLLEQDYLQDSRIGTENILNVLPEAVIDEAEGSVAGAAFTNVFDRIRLLIDVYQGDPPDDDSDDS